MREYWECLEHNTVYKKLQCPGCERDKAWGDLTGAIYEAFYIPQIVDWLNKKISKALYNLQSLNR